MTLLPLLLIIPFSILSFYFFWRMVKACQKVQSYQQTWEAVKAGKEKDLFLRILFFRGAGLFDFSYEWNLKMMGDAGMTFMMKVLKWMSVVMMVLIPIAGILLVFTVLQAQ